MNVFARSPGSPARLLIFATVLGGLVGCSGDEAAYPDGSIADAGPSSTLSWSPCDEDPGSECATLRVPRHHDDPSGPLIDLPLVRLSAATPAQRMGTILVYVGGLNSAIDIGRQIIDVFLLVAGDITRRFDLVTFDRRGARHTAAFSCIDDAWAERARRTHVEARDDGEWDELDAVWADYAARCADAYEPEGWLGSDQVAQDIELIRVALGEPQITMFVQGYTTIAASLYAQMYPDNVRAIVVDGPVARPGQAIEWRRQRGLGREIALTEIFEHCASDVTCAFHGGATVDEIGAAYDDLVEGLRTTPLSVGERTLNDRDLEAALGLMLTHIPPTESTIDGAVDEIAEALAAAEAGDGGPMLEAADIALLRREDGSYETARLSQRGGLDLSDLVCPTDLDLATARETFDELALSLPRVGMIDQERLLLCLHASSRAAPLDIAAPDAPPFFVGVGAHDGGCSTECGLDYASALANGSVVVTYDGYGWGNFLLRSTCYLDTVQEFLLDPDGWTPPPDHRCAP